MFQLSPALAIAYSVWGHRLLSVEEGRKGTRLICFPYLWFWYAGSMAAVPMVTHPVRPGTSFEQAEVRGNRMEGAAGKGLASSFRGKSHGFGSTEQSVLKSRG